MSRNGSRSNGHGAAAELSNTRSIWRNDPERRRLQLSGGFAVKRTVLETPGGLHEKRADILRIAKTIRGAEAFRLLGVSLIAPNEGRRLSRQWGSHIDDKTESLEIACEHLPDDLSASLGEAAIVGRRRGMRGPRFVGYYLDVNSQRTIIDERDQVFDTINAVEPGSIRPHISLFETVHEDVACQLAERLDELHYQNTPVTLGWATVIPVGGRNGA